MSLLVKLFVGNDVRRRTLTPPFTFDVLRAAVVSIGAPANAKLYFFDDDGDLVLIESDAEFAEARRCSPSPDSLHVGVGHDGAQALAAARQHQRLGNSVSNNNNNTNTTVKSAPSPQQQQQRTASVSAPATPVASAAPANDERSLKQMVEAVVQEALRGSLPQLQAAARSGDDAERRRVAALEQQLADMKQQLSDSISMVSSMRVQPPPASQPVAAPVPGRFVSAEQQLIDQQLQEALRLSRLEAEQAEAKLVAEKLRQSRSEASPFSAAAPLFQSMFVHNDAADSPVDFGALLAAVAANADAAQLLPFVRRFLQRPNDDAAADELMTHLRTACAAAMGSRPNAVDEARRAVQQALRYVRQRPHVREFLAELLESAPLGALLSALAASVGKPAAAATSAATPTTRTAPNFGDASIIASYRDDVNSGRVVCDECMVVIRGVRFKCTTCRDFDLCAACEPNTKHDPEHALLKVRPSAAAAAAEAARNHALSSLSAAIGTKTPDAPAEVKPAVAVEQPAADAAPAEEKSVDASSDDQAAAHARLRGYRAALVRDVTLPDGARVRPNASLTKVWRLQNSGSTAWPAGTTLGFVGGSDFSAVPTSIPDGVEPSSVIDVTLRCTAPTRAGRYVGYWRLIDPRGAPFGERIWLDVDVADGSTGNANASATPSPVLKNSNDDESWMALAKQLEAAKEKERLEKERAEKDARERAEKDARERAEKEERARAEKEARERAEKEARDQAADREARERTEKAAAVERQYADKLRQLASMGFQGERVKVLIVKHNGNVLNVVQELLEENVV